MSTRTVLRPKTLATIDMSVSSTATEATILQGLSMVSYAVAWTGTSPVGTIALEVSNDFSLEANGAILNAGTWNIAPIDVNGALQTSAAVTGNTGNGMIDVTATGVYACRLLYTRASGTGSLIPTVSGKVA